MIAHCLKPVLISALAVAFLTTGSGVQAGDLGNLSTRGFVGKGEDVLIGGIIVTGNTPKRVVLRAIGGPLNINGTPGAGVLQDPILDLHDSSGNTLQANDDWRYGPELEMEASTLAPNGDYDSALIATLSPGNYTAIVHGYAHGTGIALVEAYDPDPASGSRLAEMSTRGNVRTGDEILIGGFIVSSGATRVLLRAIGPTLTAFGISNALQNPTLELRDGNAALIEANDDWKSDKQKEITDTGIPPVDDRESALVRTLGTGSYTALVRGKNSSVGIALVEIYRLP
ncbi:MAG: hypothetical protein QOE26_2527 [Verrucomicrobiota bacterium]|jgi:hypothetical protein